MAKVKGLAFRSVLRALEELEGKRARDALFDFLPARTKSVLEVLAASSWYPIEDYAALWDAIQKATGNRRDLPRRIGYRAVEQDLKFIHRIAFAALSTNSVLGISARLFGSYYDTGRCVSEAIEERRVRVRFSGCEGFSEPMWTELRGAMECFAEQSSKMRAASTLVSGGTHLSPSCEMEVRWFVGQSATL